MSIFTPKAPVVNTKDFVTKDILTKSRKAGYPVFYEVNGSRTNSYFQALKAKKAGYAPIANINGIYYALKFR